jgi:methionine-rich copper-binding protein CopC
MRARGRLLAALALVGVCLLASALPALAHSRPVRFDPAPGAILDAPPARIQGWFSTDIRRADDSFIRVLDGSGQRVDSGDVTLSTNRRQMSVSLRAGLGPGRYLVHWSTLDDGDGDTFAGCYAFFVGNAAAESAISGGDPLDGGSLCPAVAETGEDENADMSATDEGEDDGSDVPIWGLVVGIVAGVVVGGVGGRFLATRS